MRFLLSFSPVLLFLAFLILLDSFKLINIKILSSAIIFGLLAAGFSGLINVYLLELFNIDIIYFKGFVAPIIEEFFKSLFLIYLIYKSKIGFLIDGAIYGFAVGAGFSILENIFYLKIISDTTIITWIVRGFGTAIMHGGTCAIFTLAVMGFVTTREKIKIHFIITAYCIAVLIHSFYNNFIFSPLISAIIIFVLIPVILILVFINNEKSLKNWLDVEFDSEAKLLFMINKGNFSSTKSGKYLLSIKNNFKPETVIDILCYLKIYLELSIRAKSNILLKEADLPIPTYDDTENKLKEFGFLSKSIGRTALMSLTPILRIKPKDIWKLNSLKN